MACVRDCPGVVNFLVSVACVIFAGIAELWLVGPGHLAGNAWSGLLSTYLAVAGVAAVLAGFGGVVVTIGVTSGNSRVRHLRGWGGDAIARNWVSIITTGVWAAAAAVAAALLLLLGRVTLSAGAFVIALALCAHSILRQVWLLRMIASLSAEDDREAKPGASNLID